MLRSHKKILLIGLLVLGLLGLVYGFLSSRPEMISDSNLRTPEPPNPELDHMLSWSARVNKPDMTVKSVGGEALVAAMQDAPSSNDIEIQQAIIEQQKIAFQSEGGVGGAGPKEFQAVAGDESMITDESQSDVPLLSDQNGFVDLNLVERKPIKVVLLEGDEIIIDDVNEEIGKFKGLINATENEGKDSTSSSIEVAGQSELVVLPDLDQELMSGKDALSLKYQASYKKLQSVTQRLKIANDENASLKDRFDQVAGENQKLAQIIRDIDVQIKELTVID